MLHFASLSHLLFGTVYLDASQMFNVTLVLIYSAILVIVTSIISLRTNDPDPMLAGRNMPWWLVAGSIVGTGVSSIAFLAFPSKGFNLDFNFLSGIFVAETLGVISALLFFVEFLRKSRNASIYTLIGDRFGKWASTYASISFIIYTTVRTGVITCLVAQGIHLICNVDILSVIILTGAIVLFYTYMSGIEGVMWTDFFQAGFLIVAGIASLCFLMEEMPDHGQHLWATLTQIPGFVDQADIFQATNWPLMLTIWFYFIFENWSFYGSNQAIAQRYIVARSIGHAKWGLIAGGLLMPIVIGLFFSIGVILFAINALNDGHLLALSGSADSLFGYFIAHHFPNGLKGLAIIGILAAAMSTIDTGINSSSTVLICNLYEPYAKASGHFKNLVTVQVLRASSILFGVIGIISAYYVHKNGEGILDFFWSAIGVVSSGVLGLFLLMRLSKKAGPKAAITGVGVGVLVAAWMTFTRGKSYAWASPFHFMLTLPLSTSTTIVVGLIVSRFLQDDKVTTSLAYSEEISLKIRQQLAKRRLRAKKNVFADSLRPKPLYRLYASIGAMIGTIIFFERTRIGLNATDCFFLILSIICLMSVVLLPLIFSNTTNKRYILTYLILLGIAFPFLGAIGLFSHPDEHVFGYFYLLTLAGLGTMVGWSLLSLVTMVATACAAQTSVYLYAQAGVPDNWAIMGIGALGIFTYFAMDAAKENVVIERTLGRVHTIIEKIYAKVVDTSIGLIGEKRAINFQDLDRFAKSAGELKFMLSTLLGATDANPEETNLEISIRETLEHVCNRLPSKAKKAIHMIGDPDFKILGNRDILETAISNILDNAIYYIERGQATKIICSLNDNKKTLTIANDGPPIQPKDIPYIFDLGYSADKESLGLGLTYTKKMLEAMRSGIRLISKPQDKMVAFRLYFPKYAQLPPEAQMYPIKDHHTPLHESAS